MAETDISATTKSNMKDNVSDYSVDPMETDGVSEQEETYWDNDNWTQQFGYYKQIPELKSAIDAMAKWTIGRGFNADDNTSVISVSYTHLTLPTN